MSCHRCRGPSDNTHAHACRQCRSVTYCSSRCRGNHISSHRNECQMLSSVEARYRHIPTRVLVNAYRSAAEAPGDKRKDPYSVVIGDDQFQNVVIDGEPDAKRAKFNSLLQRFEANIQDSNQYVSESELREKALRTTLIENLSKKNAKKAKAPSYLATIWANANFIPPLMKPENPTHDPTIERTHAQNRTHHMIAAHAESMDAMKMAHDEFMQPSGNYNMEKVGDAINSKVTRKIITADYAASIIRNICVTNIIAPSFMEWYSPSETPLANSNDPMSLVVEAFAVLTEEEMGPLRDTLSGKIPGHTDDIRKLLGAFMAFRSYHRGSANFDLEFMNDIDKSQYAEYKPFVSLARWWQEHRPLKWVIAANLYYDKMVGTDVAGPGIQAYIRKAYNAIASFRKGGVMLAAQAMNRDDAFEFTHVPLLQNNPTDVPYPRMTKKETDTVKFLTGPICAAVETASGNMHIRSIPGQNTGAHLKTVGGSLVVWNDCRPGDVVNTHVRKHLTHVNGIIFRSLKQLRPTSRGKQAIFPILKHIGSSGITFLRGSALVGGNGEDGYDLTPWPESDANMEVVFPLISGSVTRLQGTLETVTGPSPNSAVVSIGSLLANGADVRLSVPSTSILLIGTIKTVTRLGKITIHDSYKITKIMSGFTNPVKELDTFTLRSVGNATKDSELQFLEEIDTINDSVIFIACKGLRSVKNLYNPQIKQYLVIIDTPALSGVESVDVPRVVYRIDSTDQEEMVGDRNKWGFWADDKLRGMYSDGNRLSRDILVYVHTPKEVVQSL